MLYGEVPGTSNPFVDVYPLTIRKAITSFLPRKNVVLSVSCCVILGFLPFMGS